MAFSLTAWSPARAPELPVELWDLILSQLPDGELLRTACICRAWNELSIALYMRRHNVAAYPSSSTRRSIFPVYSRDPGPYKKRKNVALLRPSADSNAPFSIWDRVGYPYFKP
ncbi:hypothetical protein K438DRAFT_1957293 [Mycena galopus ATCC 62051]|nr:hypothetical protein K438DRAFT_1957293 [Mycena galopus ATCC 62051]